MRYREPMAHKESRLREAIDILAFLFTVVIVLFLLSIADIRGLTPA